METRWGTAWRFQDVYPTGRLVGIEPAVPHAYLDTETTGLGGSGAYAFTASIARPLDRAPGLELIQLFLTEPAGEAAFLQLLSEELNASPAVATYNGASFDLPLLRARWVMTRQPGEFEHPEHLDLLTVTRALLRQRLESCTLRNVEIRLLGFDREEDLPGAMVPDAYFLYLRQGWSPTLAAALEHNRQDVLSLYHLHARLLQRIEGEDADMEAGDYLALGRHLARQGRRADGWRALRRAAEMADGHASAAASVLLARRLARRRRYRAAESVLAAPARASALAAIARARLLEWRLGDLAAALGVVEVALEEVRNPALEADLVRRRERLLYKLGSGQGRRGVERQRTLLDERAQRRQQLGVEGSLVGLQLGQGL